MLKCDSDNESYRAAPEAEKAGTFSFGSLEELKKEKAATAKTETVAEQWA